MPIALLTEVPTQGETPLQLSGVIFDIDGTLVDSNRQQARAWSKALGEVSVKISPGEVRPFVGMRDDYLLSSLTGLDSGAPALLQIPLRKSEIFCSEFLSTVHQFPGTRELVYRLTRMGMKMTLGTSSHRNEIEALLKIAQVDDLLSSPKRKSVFSDGLTDALNALKLPASRVIFIADTPHDIKAARKVGLATVALRCGGWNDDSFRGALAVYDDLEDLCLRFNSSLLSSPLLSPTG